MALEWGFAVKGVPREGASLHLLAGRSISVSLFPPMHLYKDIKEMKGKKFAITTVGSLTDWLLKHAAISQGWKHDDLHRRAARWFRDKLCARTRPGQVDGIVLAIESCYMLVNRGEGKIIARMGDFVPHFHTHVIFARQDLIDNKARSS